MALVLIVGTAPFAAHAEEAYPVAEEQYLDEDAQYLSAEDGYYVRWSVPLRNKTVSTTCLANTSCSLSFSVLPWSKFQISATYYQILDGKLVNSFSVNTNCAWSDPSSSSITVDWLGNIEVSGVSGTYVVTSKLKDPMGNSFTARFSINISNVSLGQSEKARCAMLDVLAEDTYNLLSSFSTVESYLTAMNMGTHRGDSPLLQSSRNENDARLDHVILAALPGASIAKVAKFPADNPLLTCLAVQCDGKTYISYRTTMSWSEYLANDCGPLKYAYYHAMEFYEWLGCNADNTILVGCDAGGAVASYVAYRKGCKAYQFGSVITGILGVRDALLDSPHFVASHYTGHRCEYYAKPARDTILYDPALNYVHIETGVARYEGPSSNSNICFGSSDPDTLYLSTESFAYRYIMLGDGDDFLCSQNDWLTEAVNYLNGSSSVGGFYTALKTGTMLMAGLQQILVTLIMDVATSEPNIIVGGKGNDYICGSLKNDHYLYTYGDGCDIISDIGGSDRIYLIDCEGISCELIYYHSSADLLLNGELAIDLRQVLKGRGTIDIYFGYPDNAVHFDTIERELPLFDLMHWIGLRCPVNVHIKDASGNTVILLKDGVESSYEEEFGQFSVVYDGEEYTKSILLADSSYHVVVEGIGEGSMDCTSEYYDPETNKTTSISYRGIPVVTGALYYPELTDSGSLVLQVDLDGDGIIDQTISDNTSLTLDLEKTEMALGDTLTLNATVIPSSTPLTWASCDENVATVDENGLVTAVGAGDALVGVITNTGCQKFAYCWITVPETEIDASAFEISGVESAYLYTGAAIEPELTVSYKALSLVRERDYWVSYDNQVEVGTASVTVHGMGYYSGEVTMTFQIVEPSLTVSEKVNDLVDECSAKGFDSEYAKALWLHDWLTSNADYDFTYTYYDPDGVLLYGTGVCQSYADAFQLLLNGIGIESRVVISPEMDHAWNVAKIDGAWCHIDCTWDDPASGLENHSYFGLNDTLMSRDHTWDKSMYPACDSLDNFYYVRNGVLCADDRDGVLAWLDQKAAANTETIELYYTGDDVDFSVADVFDAWFSENNWKYGLRSYELRGSRYYVSISIVYTEPWTPSAELTEPVACPNFTLSGPDGSYKLSNYDDNGLVLVFGRNGCLNTQGLMDRLHSELELLNNSGVDVIVSIIEAHSIDGLSSMLEAYPNFRYAYDGYSVAQSLLSAVGCTEEYLVYPFVFIINSDQQIVYYSTGYVSSVDVLVGEAFATATGQAVPLPVKEGYSNSQDQDLSVLTSDPAIMRLWEVSLASNETLFLYNYSPRSYTAVQQMALYEESYELFSKLGISMVACFDTIDEDELSECRSTYPHIVFVEDTTGYVMWSMLDLVGYEETSAYYLSNYLINGNGYVIDYRNGSTYNFQEITGHCIDLLDFPNKVPAASVSIGKEAFNGTAFYSIDLSGSSVRYIESAAFSNCSNLTLMRIPSSVSLIADDAFDGCDSLIIICAYNSAAYNYAIEHSIDYILY
ncbi:MAG: transglutaminase domain-containing protein [Aristaeellaceae bacterium]